MAFLVAVQQLGGGNSQIYQGNNVPAMYANVTDFFERFLLATDNQDEVSSQINLSRKLLDKSVRRNWKLINTCDFSSKLTLAARFYLRA